MASGDGDHDIAYEEEDYESDEDRAIANMEAEGIWAHTEKPPGHMPGPIALENRLWAIECAVNSSYAISPEGELGWRNPGGLPADWSVKEWTDLPEDQKRLALKAHEVMPWGHFSAEQKETIIGNVLAGLPPSEWASGLKPVPDPPAPGAAERESPEEHHHPGPEMPEPEI